MTTPAVQGHPSVVYHTQGGPVIGDLALAMAQSSTEMVELLKKTVEPTTRPTLRTYFLRKRRPRKSCFGHSPLFVGSLATILLCFSLKYLNAASSLASDGKS